MHGNWSCKTIKRSVDLSGGQLFEQAIHIYDRCRTFMGDPKFVTALMSNQCHNDIAGYTIEDVSASICGFPTGAVAAITANNYEVPGKNSQTSKVVFEKVTAEFIDYNHATFTYTAENPVRTEVVESEKDSYAEEVRNFFVVWKREKRLPVI